jgi:hypothetical protein
MEGEKKETSFEFQIFILFKNKTSLESTKQKTKTQNQSSPRKGAPNLKSDFYNKKVVNALKRLEPFHYK